MLVESKTAVLTAPFETEAGDTLTQVEIAYEEYGTIGSPVIVIAHGGLSSHHAAGKYHQDDALPGWWDDLIGEGKVFDTNKYHIISTNTLGSMYGSTSAKSINPLTGGRYGPTFPTLTMADIASALYQFLKQIGVNKVEIMAGPSMGSLLTLQMAAQYPDLINKAVCAATAGRMSVDGLCMHHFMINAIKMDPAFCNGWYDNNTVLPSMRLIAQATKFYYLHENIIKKLCWDTVPESPNSQAIRSQKVTDFLQASSDADVAGKDPNCYITILNAINSFDLSNGFDSFEQCVKRIKCPVLLMNIDTDREFNIAWAQELADILNNDGTQQASVKLLTSDWGHLGCIKETAQMDKHIREFLA